MNFEGFQPWKILRFGGMVDWDDPTQLPNGVAILAQNMQYLAESTRVRDGLRHTMSYLADTADVTGIEVLRVLNAAVAWASVIFTSDGRLLTESPPGSGTLVPIAPANILGSLPFPANASMLTAKAFNRIYMAFSNLKNGMGTPAVLDGPSGNVSPITQNPIGMPWTPGTFAQVGDLIKPVSAQGHWFRCTQAGIMQPQEPEWPVLDGYFTLQSGTAVFNPPTATDGVTQWEEWTPAAPTNLPIPPSPEPLTNNPGGGAIPAGQDVYVVVEYTYQGLGTQWSPPVVFANTGANDAITVSFQNPTDNPYFGQGGPRIPRWLAQMVQHPELFPEVVTGPDYYIFVASVAHGAAAPTQYAPITADPLNLWQGPIVITAIPAANTNPPGSTVVCPITNAIFKGETGTRQMILVRYDQNGQPSPVDPGAPIPVPFTNLGTQPYVFFPPGGPNDGMDTAAFSVVGIGAAGPFFFLNAPDPAQPFSTGLVSINRNANAVTAVVTDASGLAAGDTIALANSIIATSPIALVAAPNGVVTTDQVNVPPQPPHFGGISYYSKAEYQTQEPHGLVVNDTVTVIGVANGLFNVTNARVTDVPDATHFKVALFSQSLQKSGGGSIAGTEGNVFDTSFVGEFVLATVNLANNTVTWPQTAANSAPVGPFPSVVISVQQTLPTQAPAGTVALPLNFDDTSLSDASENDVTEQLNCMVLPPCIDVAFLPSVQRMVYASDQEETGLIFSEESFPGVIDGDNAILDIEVTNGGICVGAREMRNGDIIAFKSNGGYKLTPSTNVPGEWGVNRLWAGKGPASGRGIGTTRDNTPGESFAVFFDPETGLHRYPGLNGEILTDLSWELKSRRPEILSTVDRINRNAGETIWVVVDQDRKEIKVGVPLDGATTPSHILTMSYVNGWDPPLMMTLTGEWIESRTSRRWSIDPIKTRCGKVLDRNLVTLVDPRVDTRQMLFGMSGLPGGTFVDFQQPNVYDDNGAGIDARYTHAYAKDQVGRKLLFVGFTGRAIGNGALVIQPQTGNAQYDQGIPEKTVALLSTTDATDFAKGLKLSRPRAALQLSNGAVPGAWFEVHELVLYYRPIGTAGS